MGRQADANAVVPLPVRDGVGPSYLWLPAGQWNNLLHFLVEQFPGVGEAVWLIRTARGGVAAAAGKALPPDSPYQDGMRIWYYRELDFETPTPFEEQILFQDEPLLVVDKPHFLPMAPAGRFLH